MLEPIFAIAIATSKNTTHFKSCQKWPKNDHLAFLPRFSLNLRYTRYIAYDSFSTCFLLIKNVFIAKSFFPLSQTLSLELLSDLRGDKFSCFSSDVKKNELRGRQKRQQRKITYEKVDVVCFLPLLQHNIQL